MRRTSPLRPQSRLQEIVEAEPTRAAEASLEQVETEELRIKAIGLRGQVRMQFLKSVLWALPFSIPFLGGLEWNRQLVGTLTISGLLLGGSAIRGIRAWRHLRHTLALTSPASEDQT